MPMTDTPLMKRYFNVHCMETTQDEDTQSFAEYVRGLNPEERSEVQAELTQMLDSESVPLQEIGSEANRWFDSFRSALEWLQSLEAATSGLFQSEASQTQIQPTKDSNGSILVEGDSALVIQDLKVKGGSSDLKRGTLVKNIRLTDDPALIECRVDGSTLVLKTQFLKKA